MDWIQQWQSKLNKQNGVAPLVRTGGSRHTGLAALPYRNIHEVFLQKNSRYSILFFKSFVYRLSYFPLRKILSCLRKRTVTYLLATVL